MSGKLKLDDIENAQMFHAYLMGGTCPAGIATRKRPRKMTAEQAFAVIYVLQEAFDAIPDFFELCGECGWLYNSEAEGHSTDKGKFYCDNCSHLCNCKDCRAWRTGKR